MIFLILTYTDAQKLFETDSLVLSPGQVLTLSCKISGYSPAGKALEWVGGMCGSGNTCYSDKLKSRFQVTLKGQNMQTEETAVYYCARDTRHTNTQVLELGRKAALVSVPATLYPLFFFTFQDPPSRRAQHQNKSP
uniref:Ig-like domain-containing protein n=1 Tax=Sinocyclocheilus anshuiensis TaxID=1608454 RepID=A0A671QLZ4_9TELE